MSYRTLDYRIDDRILLLTLNRPEQLNAFTVEMADELVDAFERASLDDAVGAVVVTGAGRAFCAGMDLSVEGNVFGLDESQQPTLEDVTERLHEPAIERGVRDTGGRVVLSIFHCRKPVIAAINGAAVGVGATLTLAMDVRMASEKARFGFVFGKIGIPMDACASWFLPRVVGLPQALEWLYSAEVFDAPEALRGRLVRSIHAPDKLLDAALALAHTFCDNRSPVATAMMRQMLYRNSAQPHPLVAHRIDSLGIFYTSMADGREGVAAFLDKREPVFTGRASQMPPFFDEWIEGSDSI
jgi:enoyl-CoA hydratase/carnithine racemase